MEPENPKESSSKKALSSKSFDELVNLLLKLQAKLRGKTAAKDSAAGKMDVVIIILANQEEKGRTAKTGRLPKPKIPKSEWIEDLCAEIEKGSASA